MTPIGRTRVAIPENGTNENDGVARGCQLADNSINGGFGADIDRELVRRAEHIGLLMQSAGECNFLLIAADNDSTAESGETA